MDFQPKKKRTNRGRRGQHGCSTGWNDGGTHLATEASFESNVLRIRVIHVIRGSSFSFLEPVEQKLITFASLTSRLKELDPVKKEREFPNQRRSANQTLLWSKMLG